MFILDPVCGQLLGHNLTSLVKYRSYFGAFGYYGQIIPIASRLLPDRFAKQNNVERAFGFYYHNRMRVADEFGNPIIDETSGSPDYEERQLLAAQADFANLFKQFQIGGGDALFFPSIDFYAALGLFNQLNQITLDGAPRVYIRFIGVMEYASTLFSNAKREIIRQIKGAIAKGHAIHLSAESAVYADQLAVLIGAPVATTPVPPFHEYLPLDEGDTFTVISPGSGRVDKGFDLLPDIISIFRRSHPKRDVRFVVQNLPMWDLEHNMRWATQLYAGPGIELLPASISFEEMTNLFARSHLVLMPYAANVYALRSSAILTESVGHGRQIVTSQGTGFEAEVTYFGLGKVCNTVDAYVTAIADYSTVKRGALAQTAAQARQRYSGYILAQYKEWLQ